VRELVVLAIGIATLFLPRTFVAGLVVSRASGPGPGVARAALFALALPFTLMLVVSQTFSPFLYFQF
jgi:hypothetical protein